MGDGPKRQSGFLHSLMQFIIIITLIISLISIAPTVGQAGDADLSITPADIVFSNDNPEGGEVIDIEVTVHNLGPAPASNVIVEFYQGTLPILPTKTIPAIASGADASTVHQWVAPIPGEYTIRIMVNGDQPDPENSNNEAQRNITVGTMVPTIIVSADLSSEIIQSKAPFTVNGSAEINGEPVNDGDVKVEVIQTGVSNETKTGADGTFTVEMLGPTDQNKYDVKVTVTQGAVNGETQLNLSVIQPDLMITKLTISPKEPKVDDNVKVNIGVQNIGNGTAKDVKLTVKIDEVVVLEKDLGDMVNGQTLPVTHVWKAKKGSHSFQVIVDPDDEIEEISEDNNMKLENAEVTGKEKPTPSFEMAIFVLAVLIIFLVMRNGDDKKRTRG